MLAIPLSLLPLRVAGSSGADRAPSLSDCESYGSSLTAAGCCEICWNRRKSISDMRTRGSELLRAAPAYARDCCRAKAGRGRCWGAGVLPGPSGVTSVSDALPSRVGRRRLVRVAIAGGWSGWLISSAALEESVGKQW